MYIYESHLGGYYTSDTLYDYEQLCCDSCGDCDTYLGEAKTREDALKLIDTKLYTVKYIEEFLRENFE